MKRRDLLKRFERNGWRFEREGDDHALYTNGKESEAIPRHSEIDEILAKENYPAPKVKIKERVSA